jgi:hypothetical protein
MQESISSIKHDNLNDKTKILMMKLVIIIIATAIKT